MGFWLSWGSKCTDLVQHIHAVHSDCSGEMAPVNKKTVKYCFVNDSRFPLLFSGEKQKVKSRVEMGKEFL